MAEQTSLKTLSDFANILIGTQVVVENEEGLLFTGILRRVTNNLEVELSFVQKLPLSDDTKFVLYRKDTIRKMMMKVTRLSGDYYGKESEKVFHLDNEIGINGENCYESDKEFQQWEDDDYEEFDDGLCDFNENKREPKNTTNSNWRKSKITGWSVDEMFRANKDKCIGKSSFDENLTQYSNVDIGQRTLEEKKRAEELARQIEMNPVSRRNALLENDDEERDLDALTRFREEESKSSKIEKKVDENPPQTKIENIDVDEKKPEKVIKKEICKEKEEEKEEEKATTLLPEKQSEEENKTAKFTFNPKAAPFVPKQQQRDVNSNPSPTIANATFNNNNLPSHQLQAFVPVPAVHIPPNVQISQVLPPPNIVYNNPLVYPQQQQMPLPLYAYAPYVPTSIPPPPSSVVHPSMQLPQHGKPLYTAAAHQAGMVVSGPPQYFQQQPQQQIVYPQHPNAAAAVPLTAPLTAVYSSLQMPQQGKPLYTAAANPGMIISTPPQQYLPQQPQQQPPPQLMYPHAAAPPPAPTPPTSVYCTVPQIQMPQQGKPLYAGAANPQGMIVSTPPQNVQHQQQPQVMYPHAAAAPPVMSHQLPAGYNVNAAPYIYSTVPPSSTAAPIPQTLPPGAGQQNAAEIDHRFVMQQHQQYGPYNGQQQYNSGSYY